MGMKTGYLPSEEVFRNQTREQYPRERPSDGEFQSRHRKIRKFMKEEGLDCLLIAGGTGTWDRCWTNTRWAANHVGCQLTNYSYVVFPLDAKPTVLAFPLIVELPGRRSAEIVEDVRGTTKPDITAVERFREIGLTKGVVGLVETEMKTSIPVNHYQTLTREMPDIEFRSVTGQWWKKVRLVRSDEEISFIERAALIGDAMNEAVAADIEAGMPERHVFASLSDAMIRNGGETPSMVLAASSSMYWPFDTMQRERPVNRILTRGDVIITEVSPRYQDGSECQTGRTYVLGKPTRAYEDMGKVMMDVYHRIVDTLRPGKTDRDIIKAGQVIKEAGYRWFSPLIHGAEGGAVGSQPFVAPAIPLPEEQPFVFEPNIVVVIEAHVEKPDHSGGVFMADTWIVTDGEPRCLNVPPTEPFVYI